MREIYLTPGVHSPVGGRKDLSDRLHDAVVHDRVFFQCLAPKTAGELIALAFDAAYWWRISPREAMELQLSELRLYVDQWNRIQEKLESGE